MVFKISSIYKERIGKGPRHEEKKLLPLKRRKRKGFFNAAQTNATVTNCSIGGTDPILSNPVVVSEVNFV
jgi:hypothetical protein